MMTLEQKNLIAMQLLKEKFQDLKFQLALAVMGICAFLISSLFNENTPAHSMFFAAGLGLAIFLFIYMFIDKQQAEIKRINFEKFKDKLSYAEMLKKLEIDPEEMPKEAQPSV